MHFFRYFDTDNILKIMKFNNFQGKLTDISVRTNSLLFTCCSSCVSQMWPGIGVHHHRDQTSDFILAEILVTSPLKLLLLFTGSKYPENNTFSFENMSTVSNLDNSWHCPVLRQLFAYISVINIVFKFQLNVFGVLLPKKHCFLL